MDWIPLSFHFKQVVEGGYRYLDKCGEFMLAAEKLSFMPNKATPIRAELTIPELAISMTADTKEIVLFQESHAEDQKPFFEILTKVVDLYSKFFSPSRIESNGLASKSFLPFADINQALAQSLKVGDVYNKAIAKAIGMAPSQKNLDYHFSSGSFNFHMRLQPATFNSVTQRSFNAPVLSTDSQKKRVERLNKKAKRGNPELAHALMLELDLIEFNPPGNSLKAQFESLQKKKIEIQKMVLPK